MPLAAEVDAFDTEIGGHQELLAACNLQNRSIIADTADDSVMSGLSRQPPDSLNQFSFCKYQNSLP
jgi:hypothetical protein